MPINFNDSSKLPVSWWKSSYSPDQDTCVEFALPADNSVLVRDSKNPTGPALRFSKGAAMTFISDVSNGVWDLGLVD